MKLKTGDEKGRPRRFHLRDNTDYEHRKFVNLCAAAFVLALALGIGWTIKAFDLQIKLENCLNSGRKECREIADTGVRSYVKLNK